MTLQSDLTGPPQGQTSGGPTAVYRIDMETDGLLLAIVHAEGFTARLMMFDSQGRVIVHHALTDFARARRRLESRAKGQVELLAESPDAMADLERSLEGAFHGELLELAMRRVEKRVKPRNWQAFRLTTIEGLSGADAADRLQMPVAQLYVAKNRVQKLLQEEILILRGE